MVEFNCGTPASVDAPDAAQWCVADSMLTRPLSSTQDQASVTDPITNSPLVSVVMTTYNSGKFVSEAIHSILEQSYWNIELVVVDDMSSDDTVSIIESFMLVDSRVKLIRYGRNRGTYFSKNIGIVFAKGEIVTFMDSDDTCSPERIAHQVNDLRRPGVMVSTVGYSRHFVDGRVEGKRRHAYISQMFRKNLCNIVGFFDSVRTSADEEFLRRVISVFGADSHYFNNCVLYFARVRGDSLSHHPSNPKFSEETGGLSPARRAYIDNVVAWHAAVVDAGRAPFLDFPLMRRPFDVDEKLQVVRDSCQSFSRTAILLYDSGQPEVTDQDKLLTLFDRVIVVGHPSPLDKPGVLHISASVDEFSDSEVGPVPSGMVMILKSSYAYSPDYFRIATLILSVVGEGIRVTARVPGGDLSAPGRASILLGATSFIIGDERVSLNLKVADLNDFPILSQARLTDQLTIPYADVAKAKDGIKADLEDILAGTQDKCYLTFLSDEKINPAPVGGASRFNVLRESGVAGGGSEEAVYSDSSSASANGGNIGQIIHGIKRFFLICCSIFNRFERILLVIGFAVALSLCAAASNEFGMFFGFSSLLAFMYLSSLGVFVARRTRLSMSGAPASEIFNVRDIWRGLVRRVINFKGK